MSDRMELAHEMGLLDLESNDINDGKQLWAALSDCGPPRTPHSMQTVSSFIKRLVKPPMGSFVPHQMIAGHGRVPSKAAPASLPTIIEGQQAAAAGMVDQQALMSVFQTTLGAISNLISITQAMAATPGATPVAMPPMPMPPFPPMPLATIDLTGAVSAPIVNAPAESNAATSNPKRLSTTEHRWRQPDSTGSNGAWKNAKRARAAEHLQIMANQVGGASSSSGEMPPRTSTVTMCAYCLKGQPKSRCVFVACSKCCPALFDAQCFCPEPAHAMQQ